MRYTCVNESKKLTLIFFLVVEDTICDVNDLENSLEGVILDAFRKHYFEVSHIIIICGQFMVYHEYFTFYLFFAFL